MKFPALVLSGVAAIALTACSSEPATNTAPDDSMAADEMANDTTESTNPMVGGAPMMADRTIVENASKASNLTTLVKAVTQAGLGETLSGAGPFTVFAPTNDAFAAVPKATLDGLMADGGKDDLTKVLTYHVVPGKLTAADLASKIKAGGGTAKLTTVEGEDLTLTMDGDMIKIAGMGGSTATVSTADVMQSNGVVHVVDGVLTPSM